MSNNRLPPITPPRSPLMQAVNTIVTFLIGGPLVGGVVAYGVLAVYWTFTGSLTEIAVKFYEAMYETMWAAYLVGLVPAIIVGMIIAYVDNRFGDTPFILAVALGLAAGTLWVLIAGNALDILLRATVLVVCVTSTLVCWNMRRQEGD